MTDRPSRPSEAGDTAPQGPELPAEEAAVRDLLAGARHTDPVPTDVATRLDEVLAGLRPTGTADPASADPASADPASVDPGAAEPGAAVAALPRRRAVRLLAAAAAVVVVAGGASLVVRQLQQGGSSAASSDVGAEAGSAASGPGTTSGDSPDLGARAGSPEAAAPQQAGSGQLPLLRPGHLAADAAALLAGLRSGTAPVAGVVRGRDPLGSRREDLAAPAPSSGPSAGPSAGGTVPCPGPRSPDSWTTTVRYDGGTAALVVRTARDGRQPVRVWSCDGSRLLAATSVAGP